MVRGRSTAEDFRLARLARTRYSLADLTLAADLATARTIAARVNAGRAAGAPSTPAGDRSADPVAPTGRAADTATAEAEPPLTAGQLHAAGILVAIMGRLVDRYRADADPEALVAADAWLRERLGNRPVRTAVGAFVQEFPARLAVPETPDPPSAIAQLLLLASLDENSAVDPFRELVDLRAVREGRTLVTVADALEGFFAGRPGFGPEGRSLVELLRQPAAAAPGSLADQLRWIRSNWSGLFGGVLDDLLERLLVALDVLAEERLAADRAWFAAHDAGAGGPAEVYRYDLGEEERFSEDRDWMPSLVLVAKSTYVWLDQLSRRFGRDIRTLDAVPDEELDRLARWGITGLWLIGLWERSVASERIKRLRGDPEAVASAYSLDDYVIAADLGGPGALASLRDRAAGRGIRLASDMVPNHMGIDSRWVIQHPERFLSLPESPFPGYTFTGPDLSSDGRVGIVLEDHYYDATDAAVVFKRFDRQTGEERYVYHGNDGTSFPWNDTAQLDYSKAEVREAVIQAILDVARQFPVIRFDAAMVLARKHVQRLWFPEPGQGGAIPSRAGRGMTRAEFDRAMPHEFWREVVDRVAAEVPGTLLLAEAFWLLEGYFVRTLGMHRVYNSAFMNMLRDERNADYRLVIRNTLEFDPAILGRFVNFMSNPDERTAVDQFGTGDKYFGVAALMATLPGLPMFGHGQIEGFTEKYGMEFRRAKLDEPVDEGLLAHHERTIFPLLHRRASFAGPDAFRLYDVVAENGTVNEDVFAYSNVGPGGERSLVVYHNRYAEARGTVRESVGFNAREPDGERRMRRESLAVGLGLSGREDRWLRVRDAMTGLEGLRWSAGLVREGLRVELGPYRCLVLVDLEELGDAPGRPVATLAAELGDGWIPSIDDALAGIVLRPFHDEIRGRLAEATRRLRRTAGVPLPPKPAAQAEVIARFVEAIDGEPFDERRLRPIVSDVLRTAGLDGSAAERAADLIRGLVVADPALRRLDDPTVAAWFRDPALRAALYVHDADKIAWFDRDAFELLVEAVARLGPASLKAGEAAARVAVLTRRAEAAGYRVDELLASLAESATETPAEPARAPKRGAATRAGRAAPSGRVTKSRAPRSARRSGPPKS
jgi:glycosidase